MIRTIAWVGDGTTDGRVRHEFAAPPPRGWVWVDLSGEPEESIRHVCDELGVEQSLVQEALEAGSLPLLEERRDLVYVVLNVFTIDAQKRLRATEVDLFLGPDFLISIHDDAVQFVDAVAQRVGEGVALAVPTPAGLLSHLAMTGSRRVPALIDTLESELEALEELAMRSDPRALTQVHALRRDVIILRRVLVPQRQIYEDLAAGGHRLIDEASRHLFDRVADYQTQVLESLEAARSLLGSVLETYRGAVADQTNEIVRVLTVFSAILLPLALVAGVYGMNFVEIPLADHPYGFWLIVGGLVVVAVLLWLYFGRRGFVGAPRLSELPRAVGIGLYHVGTAPIRVVAEGIETTRRIVGLGNEKQGVRPATDTEPDEG
ncbi:MAG: magnesium transporter CorA family protein [Actinobacteria bacterium]|nr:magnesium transporter CorA family protein [Actinomycetota bacterium]MCI0544629.1 magnesium transporter CorA family protein [Actinomycetota bacterium]